MYGTKIFQFENLSVFPGLGLGVKIFIINYLYSKYPRLKKKYDNTYRLWLTLPTDAEYERRFVREEVDKVCIEIVH